MSTGIALEGYALDYAARGMAVFPLKPRGKTPMTAHGLKDATTDAHRIHEWWAKHPDANIGVVTGRASDLAVLDIDGREGERSLLDLPDILPDTWTAVTGNGAHLWFKYPSFELRNSAGRLGDGLDVRAEGGYVVAPPSYHPNGERYAWLGPKRPRAVWPAWLVPVVAPVTPVTAVVRLIAAGGDRSAVVPVTVTNATRYAYAALAREVENVRNAAPGTRNDTLNRAAFALARFFPDDLSAREVADVLIAAAIEAGLPLAEARATIASGFRAGAAR